MAQNSSSKEANTGSTLGAAPDVAIEVVDVSFMPKSAKRRQGQNSNGAISPPDILVIDTKLPLDGLMELIPVGEGDVGAVGSSADELSDDQMEMFGAEAGGKAFWSALETGAGVPYLEGGEIKFAVVEGGRIRDGLSISDFVLKRDDR